MYQILSPKKVSSSGPSGNTSRCYFHKVLKTITLLTDFGTKDPYVGIMKGVILSTNPDVRIVDITHEVDPQDVREGAFLIEEYYRYFEKGTIHVAVVDPTVGSDRKPVVFSKDGYFFIGPDNGLFTLILDDATLVLAIENKRYMRKEISSTFHGRDIFAPAAAYLASGVRLSMFGSVVQKPVRLPGLYPVIEENVLKGEIVRFDRFGNAITNITETNIQSFSQDRMVSVTLRDLEFSAFSKSYFERETTCLIGSSGYLEFEYFRGSLKKKMGLKKGDQVTVKIS
jgi:S-adenosylmethionine hydrolase